MPPTADPKAPAPVARPEQHTVTALKAEIHGDAVRAAQGKIDAAGLSSVATALGVSHLAMGLADMLLHNSPKAAGSLSSADLDTIHALISDEVLAVTRKIAGIVEQAARAVGQVAQQAAATADHETS